MRARGALALFTGLSGAALADSPSIPRWDPPVAARCDDFDHPDRAVEAIGATKSCRAATEIYFRCEARWDNNPDMEQITVSRCEDDFQPRISAARYERYEILRDEACVERYQAKDMRILWSAVRACRVRLARDWARRFAGR